MRRNRRKGCCEAFAKTFSTWSEQEQDLRRYTLKFNTVKLATVYIQPLLRPGRVARAESKLWGRWRGPVEENVDQIVVNSFPSPRRAVLVVDDQLKACVADENEDEGVLTKSEEHAKATARLLRSPLASQYATTEDNRCKRRLKEDSVCWHQKVGTRKIREQGKGVLVAEYAVDDLPVRLHIHSCMAVGGAAVAEGFRLRCASPHCGGVASRGP